MRDPLKDHPRVSARSWNMMEYIVVFLWITFSWNSLINFLRGRWWWWCCCCCWWLFHIAGSCNVVPALGQVWASPETRGPRVRFSPPVFQPFFNLSTSDSPWWSPFLIKTFLKSTIALNCPHLPRTSLSSISSRSWHHCFSWVNWPGIMLIYPWFGLNKWILRYVYVRFIYYHYIEHGFV